jgi:sec-independent protein translocase protein TatA
MAVEFNIHNKTSIRTSRKDIKETSMNNLLLFWAPGMPEMIIILVIVLILFGANRLPQLAKGMGESIRNFKHGMTEAEAEDEKKDKAKAEAEDEKKGKAKAA